MSLDARRSGPECRARDGRVDRRWAVRDELGRRAGLYAADDLRAQVEGARGVRADGVAVGGGWWREATGVAVRLPLGHNARGPAHARRLSRPPARTQHPPDPPHPLHASPLQGPARSPRPSPGASPPCPQQQRTRARRSRTSFRRPTRPPRARRSARPPRSTRSCPARARPPSPPLRAHRRRRAACLPPQEQQQQQRRPPGRPTTCTSGQV